MTTMRPAARAADARRMDPAELHGRVALVTGAAGGIGSAVVERLAQAGAAVIALDADGERVGHLAAQAQAAGHQVSAHQLDVTDATQVEAVLLAAAEEHGPADILVHVAGVLHHSSVAELSEQTWRQTFAINTDGVFHVSRAAARPMIERKSGTIVTVTSNAALVPRVNLAAYAASKAAATMFTKCLGLELAPFGIRCNIVAPGSTDTPMLRQAGQSPASAIAGVPEQWRLGVPLGRIADPADVAAAVLFLASPASRHTTMHTLLVDGGATLTT